MTRSKLGAALRARFKTPHAALRALGIDADLLGGAPAASGGSECQKMSAALQNKIPDLNLNEQQVGHILAILNEFVPTDVIDNQDPNAEAARELAGEDDTDADAAWVERIKTFLKEKGGLSDADIEKALTLIRTPAADQPAPAPRGFGGALSRAHDSARGSFADRHPEVFRVHGFGDISPRPRREISRGTGSFADRHPEVSRILPC